MPQFFISHEPALDEIFEIGGDDAHHLIRVRRIQPGQHIQVRLWDGRALEASCVARDDERVTCRAIEYLPVAGSPLSITLYLAPLKSKNMDWAVRKAVEVGVDGIVPLITERTVVDPSPQKIDRWRRIAHEASKQSLRESAAEVREPQTMKNFLSSDLNKPGFFGDLEGPAPTVSMMEKIAAISLLVGPEGGFTPHEKEKMIAAGMKAVKMGTTQMRAETAAVVLPAMLIMLKQLEQENESDGKR